MKPKTLICKHTPPPIPVTTLPNPGNQENLPNFHFRPRNQSFLHIFLAFVTRLKILDSLKLKILIYKRTPPPVPVTTLPNPGNRENLPIIHFRPRYQLFLHIFLAFVTRYLVGSLSVLVDARFANRPVPPLGAARTQRGFACERILGGPVISEPYGSRKWNFLRSRSAVVVVVVVGRPDDGLIGAVRQLAHARAHTRSRRGR